MGGKLLRNLFWLLAIAPPLVMAGLTEVKQRADNEIPSSLTDSGEVLISSKDRSLYDVLRLLSERTDIRFFLSDQLKTLELDSDLQAANWNDATQRLLDRFNVLQKSRDGVVSTVFVLNKGEKVSVMEGEGTGTPAANNESIRQRLSAALWQTPPGFKQRDSAANNNTNNNNKPPTPEEEPSMRVPADISAEEDPAMSDPRETVNTEPEDKRLAYIDNKGYVVRTDGGTELSPHAMPQSVAEFVPPQPSF